jgi:hypothetical protein
MQQALTAPVFKSLALAGLAVGLGIAALPSSASSTQVTHRLRLHAEAQPDAVYWTRFSRCSGTLRATFDGPEIHAITFKNRATFYGCRVLATETLVPRDARSFYYDYSEEILECAPDSPVVIKTPRKGIVTVED